MHLVNRSQSHTTYYIMSCAQVVMFQPSCAAQATTTTTPFSYEQVLANAPPPTTTTTTTRLYDGNEHSPLHQVRRCRNSAKYDNVAGMSSSIREVLAVFALEFSERLEELMAALVQVKGARA